MRALVFFALVAGAVIGTKPLWDKHSGSTTTSAQGGAKTGSTAAKPLLSVRYKTGAASSSTSSQPWLQVVNVSPQSIALDTVTLRYYFTQDGTQAYAANCIYAQVGCSNVTEHVVALPTKTASADHYLEVSFTSGAGALKPTANSGAIELQLYLPGGAAVKQTNDASFVAADTSSYKPNTHIAAFVGKTLTFGQEPANDGEQAPATSAAAAVSAGVLFDDFHYSGASDPALTKHGWIVRTSSGGPGILNTWKSSGVSFPTSSGADGGEVLDLTASTDGTKSGTTQAEVDSLNVPFFTGTYAARIHFEDAPTSGDNGDPINEDFYMISPRNNDYSEMDTEYEPNGGWGAPGPRLDTTTWYSVYACDTVTSASSVPGCDRETKKNMISLGGWHTLMITAANGTVTYSMDGTTLFSTSGKYYPRESMSADFNAWFVDQQTSVTGKRVWDMDVNWFYYNSKQTMTLSQVQQTVSGLYTNGTNFVDTISKN